MELLPLLKLAVLAWLPGAVIFRLPYAARDTRAALAAEERVFWSVILSVCVSLAIVLVLAAAGQYTFSRLLAANVLIAGTLAGWVRFRLRFGPQAARPTLTALIPLALVVFAVVRFFPPSEYVIGGKDPGIYVNEGVLIAQRGSLVYRDPVVASLPGFARDLFFPSHERHDYHGLRFMGFFVSSPDSGAVVGQFPHLFPASIAIGYGVRGLSGARETVGFWAILGLLAVYFAARRVAGPIVGVAAAVLLALHVVQVWFARYPNAEMLMQALVFAAVLASIYAQADNDRFFGAIAGSLLGLLLFLRFDAVLVVAGVCSGIVLGAIHRGRPRSSWLVPLASAALLAVPYYAGPMRAYVDRPLVYLSTFDRWQYPLLLGGGVVAALALALALRPPAFLKPLAAWVPATISVALVAGAIYALYLRRPIGRLAAHDAYALRTFTVIYATLPALIAALIGFVTASRRAFWRAPELFTTVALSSLFVFYKIHIVPEHLWMARRFVAVILPGLIVFAATAAAWGLQRRGPRRLAGAAIGAVFVALLGGQYARAAQPVAEHIEYAGIIRELERLAARIGDDELLLVESRNAGSDAHVMALPLAYIYGRNVLVLDSPRPDNTTFAEFLKWARTRYRRVYFLGGGGTELLAPEWSASSVASHRFQVPEFDVSADSLPRSARLKEFDFGLYELLPAATETVSGFDLDVGINDDLHVVRFHAKEIADGHTIRWSQRQSFVTIPRFPEQAREIVLDMSSGGRPDAAEPADVRVYLADRLLGSVRVTDGFRPYALPVPAELAAGLAKSPEPARIRLMTSVWRPRTILGTPDDRELGIMLDRVQVR